MVPVPLVDFGLGDVKATRKGIDLLVRPNLRASVFSPQDFRLLVTQALHDALAFRVDSVSWFAQQIVKTVDFQFAEATQFVIFNRRRPSCSQPMARDRVRQTVLVCCEVLHTFTLVRRLHGQVVAKKGGRARVYGGAEFCLGVGGCSLRCQKRLNALSALCELNGALNIAEHAVHLVKHRNEVVRHLKEVNLSPCRLRDGQLKRRNDLAQLLLSEVAVLKLVAPQMSVSQ